MKSAIPNLCISGACPYCDGSGDRIVTHGPSLRAHRKDAGKTLTAVAEELGFTRSYLSDIELGRRPQRPAFVARFKAAVKRAQGDQRKAGA